MEQNKLGKTILNTLLLSTVLVMIGCDTSESSKSNLNKEVATPRATENKVIQGKPLKQVEWLTDGDGAIYFTVELTPDGLFKYYLPEPMRYPRPIVEGYVLKESDPELFEDLRMIFSGRYTLIEEKLPTVENGRVPTTGTWTSLAFVEVTGDKARYRKPTITLEGGIEFPISKIRDKADLFDSMYEQDI